MIFVGVDWAETHHDAAVMDDHGRVVARARVDDGLDGVRSLHALIGDHADDAGQVAVGIELDRGLLVGALVAAGYRVYAVNPRAVDRYRDRHAVSGAKSDRGDAKVLADMVRTDRHNLRLVAGDTPAVDAVRALARGHQSLIWARQRHVNQLRHALREFYPGALAAFGGDLADRDALAVLAIAPTPAHGRRLTLRQITAALRRGGRQRSVDARAAAIRDALRAEQLAAPAAGHRRLRCDHQRVGRGDRHPVAEDRRSRGRPWRQSSHSTPTPTSSTACPDSVWSWAPACSASSAMTPTATPPPRRAATTPAAARSPDNPAPAES